jgi:hypothetical protein
MAVTKPHKNRSNHRSAPRRKKAVSPRQQAPGDAQGAYEYFLARAMALPVKDVAVARGPASIARTNVDKAAKAITPYLAGLSQIAPQIDPARLADLPALARGFEYAEKLIPKQASDRAIDGALAEVSPLRQAALAYLDAAVFCGLVDAGRVRKIRAGRGKLDLASDAVAIAGMFDEAKGALAGKHPFTDEQLATLRDRGGWLADRLKPSGAVRDPKGRSAAAVVKDRFAKLLEDDYAELLKAAVAIWGVDEYRAHVPALQSRERAAPAKKPPPSGAGTNGGSSPKG